MKPALLVMAAGMGSRYGGLKQIDPVGPNGEIIIDYSVHDALSAGFGKIVFIIRPEIEADFKEAVGHRFEDLAPVEYVYQTLDACVGDFKAPAGRKKPWGTGHAVLVARDAIHEPFAVINADDYYGKTSFQLMGECLASDSPPGNEYAVVGFVLRNTLSEHGHVARGVCRLDEAGFLEKVVERTQIEKVGQGARCFADDGEELALTGDEIVSMNLWGFQPGLFDHLQEQFEEFLRQEGQELKSEFFIPTVVDRLVAAGLVRARVLKTPDSWVGVTYREDKEVAVAAVRKMIDQGVYPEKLYA